MTCRQDQAFGCRAWRVSRVAFAAALAGRTPPGPPYHVARPDDQPAKSLSSRRSRLMMLELGGVVVSRGSRRATATTRRDAKRSAARVMFGICLLFLWPGRTSSVSDFYGCLHCVLKRDVLEAIHALPSCNERIACPAARARVVGARGARENTCTHASQRMKVGCSLLGQPSNAHKRART